MRKSTTKVFLTLALIFLAVGGANSKVSLELPGVWDTNCVKVDNSYTFTGWAGGSRWIGDADWTSYDYVWIKYSGHTGSVGFFVVYDEFIEEGQYGDVYQEGRVIISGSQGVAGIKLDKTTTCTNGSKSGDHKGDVYAKHIREIKMQSH